MKIQKGKKYKCIKDVVMKASGNVEFWEGRIYLSDSDGYLTNNSGNPYHGCPDGWWRGYFEEQVEYVWGEEVEMSNNSMDWAKMVYVALDPICFGYVGLSTTSKTAYSFGVYKYCRKFQLELTHQEVADKFGIKLEQLKIVD